jgi:fatty-acyl-CoA synthase
MSGYKYQLILKRVLQQGMAWAADQEIVYRDQMRYGYSSMYQRVLRLGAALQGLGVKQGSRVGVIEWDSHRYLEMYFGIPGIGAVMHTINPRLAPDDLVYTVGHAEDEVLVFHEDFLPLAERIRTKVPTIRKFIVISDKSERPDVKWVDTEYEDLLANASPLGELPDLDETTLATQSYTTGTTGQPKGVYFTHRQLTVHTLSVAVGLSALGNYGGVNKHDVYMPLTPMFHVHAWGMPYIATMFGLKQVYPGKYEPPMLLKLVLGEKVTFSHCVPTILQTITSAPAVKGLDLSRWKVIIGGARLPKGLALDASKLGIKVYAGYGLSETCPVLTISNLKPEMESEWDDDTQMDWAIKTGVVVPLVDLKVVDAAGKEVAHDGKESGEIVVRTPWCTQGYYKEPERSEELWAGGWMHTGDVANVGERGYVQIVDRIKDVIKSGGEWIVSLELENLLSLHEGVLEAAVIGIPDEKWGERPQALVVPRAEYKDKLTADGLKAHLVKYVDEGVITSWSVPDSYIFVDDLPKTSVGKIDKKVLRSRNPAAED